MALEVYGYNGLDIYSFGMACFQIHEGAVWIPFILEKLKST